MAEKLTDTESQLKTIMEISAFALGFGLVIILGIIFILTMLTIF